MNSDKDIPLGFDTPTALPLTAEQARQWQDANREWWEAHPMRYDFTEELQAEEFSKQFYEEIDKRFYADAATMIKWRELPFDSLIDFASIRQKDVLEVGCGNGSHAQLLAANARSYTGIDLTTYAVNSTTRRLGYRGLPCRVTQMDAESMAFANDSFDSVWSWGVIHHSANTRQIIKEIHRVLRPGGEAKIMVYHRSFWSYWLFAGFFGRISYGLKTKSIHKTSQMMTDGAIARLYTPEEWKSMVSDLFEVDEVRILGSKSGLVPLPAGRIKDLLMFLTPDGVSRFLNNRMRMGNCLFSTLKKRR